MDEDVPLNNPTQVTKVEANELSVQDIHEEIINDPKKTV